MPQPGTHTAALAFLPQWWQETSDASAFEVTLACWVRACGWKAAGFICPADGPATFARSVPNTAAIEAGELISTANRLRAGEPTVVVSTPGNASRVYAPVTCPGRPLAVLWAERPAGQPFSETDLAYLALTAKALERSPALAAALGGSIDPDRLVQRLADAAVIAGRIAHDFDNILTGILGFAELSLPTLAPDSQTTSYILEIAKVGQRGITFTQQLHALNRCGESKPTPGSVPATLGREETRLKAALPAVNIEKDLGANLPAVAIDAGPLQTALGHVFENAVQACIKGGSVKVQARPADLSEVEARAYLGKVSPGPHVIVTFADTGTGIKPEVRKRLFAEPFFTTKVRHRGLGLATAFRILAAHRGGLQIESVPAPGTGTVVRVALPLAVSRPSIAVQTPPPVHNGLREDAVRPTATTVRG